MATGAILAHGTKLKIGDGADPEVFAEIGEVGDFDDSDSVPLVNVTNHQSGGYMEYIGDVKDGDEISFTVNYVDGNATHNAATGLRGMLGLAKNFQIEAPGETQGLLFKAIVTTVGRSYPVSGGALQMTVTMKKTGVPAFYTIT